MMSQGSLALPTTIYSTTGWMQLRIGGEREFSKMYDLLLYRNRNQDATNSEFKEWISQNSVTIC